MPTIDQRVNPTRYQIIPRVLVFAVREDEVLLMKLLPRDGKASTWTGRYNGPGGHIERGEDVITAARRELLEETGLSADITLCGSIIVDTGQNPGIGLFILRAEHPSGELIDTVEGLPEWVPFARISEYPLVEDVAIFLERIRKMKADDPPFVGRSFYDENDRLVVVISQRPN